MASVERPILDIHLHLAAVNSADTEGGWLPLRRRRSLGFRLLRSLAGLPSWDAANIDAEFRRLVASLANEADSLARADGFPGFAAVALAFDRAHNRDGQPLDTISDFYVPDAYASRVAAESSRLLVGVSIHPYRADALDALRQAAERGAVLVKWLPTSQEIDPADPRSAEFAAECRKLGLPLLVHTGVEALTRDANPRWNNPRSLEPLLKTGVTLVAAHAGLRSRPYGPCYFPDWVAMLPDWPNLYGDTAALSLLRPRKLLRALGSRLVADRLVNGSDWPVPNWPLWYWPGLRGEEILRLWRIRNPLWRDVATKRAAGLPAEMFTRGWEVLGRGGRS